MRTVILFVLTLSVAGTSLAQGPASIANGNCQSLRSITIGIVPWTSADLTQIWAHKLGQYFKLNSCIDAKFESAQDYRHFIERAINGDYNYIDVPPHVGSYMILKHQFRVIGIEDWESDTLFVARLGSGISTIEQAARRPVGIPDPLAAVTQIAKAYFAKLSLSPPRYINFHNHNSVLSAVLNAEVDSGVIISPIYNSYQHLLKDRIRILHREPADLVGLLLARPGTSDDSIEQLNKLLAGFDEGTTKLWQKWLPVDPARIENFHQREAESVQWLTEQLQSQ